MNDKTVITAFSVEDNEKTRTFIKQVAERLREPTFIKNPYSNKYINDLGNGKYVLTLTILYPRLYLFGALLMIGAFILKGFGWWLLPGFIIFIVGGVSFTRFYWYFFVKAGLHKAGIKTKTKLLNNKQIFSEVLKSGTGRRI